MNDDYTIEFLIKTFGEHSDQYINLQKKQSEIYQNNLNLCLALQTICKEINKCKTALHLA